MKRLFVITLSTIVSAIAINRPVYKTILTQKGFAQFLQYDVDTPPLREFTFCTWISVYELSGEQSIFTYVVKGNNRVVRLWLDFNNRLLKLSVNGKITLSIPTLLVKDVWRHICITYQSDYGACALYIDAELAFCESTQSLKSYVLPGGGSVIIGYGTAENGISNGFEGEIFGANMILISTIERNLTLKRNPLYEQKTFRRNVTGTKDFKYVVLNDLHSDEVNNNLNSVRLPRPRVNANKSYIKFKTPFSTIEHDVGISTTFERLNRTQHIPNENEIPDFTIPNNPEYSKDKGNIKFQNLLNAYDIPNYKTIHKFNTQQFSSDDRKQLMVSEYETPPPPATINHDYLDNKLKYKKPFGFMPPKNDRFLPTHIIFNTNTKTETISELETPPPSQKTSEVYGQWTSSRFAGRVLNYLKSINYQNKSIKKTPPTLPLQKVSDLFPYPSDFKVTKVRPPSQIQRNSFIGKIRHQIIKRHIPKTNIQVLNDDLRNYILTSHAQTQTKHVDLINRGISEKLMDRYYRNVDSSMSIENSESLKPQPFRPSKINSIHSLDLYNNGNSFISILPFLKSMNYFTSENKDTNDNENIMKKKIYSKGFSKGNKWQDYNYAPRRIQTDHNASIEYNNHQMHSNKKHPSVLPKYDHSMNVLQYNNNEHLIKDRELAIHVSNQSENNKDSVSILKYNHGFIPEQSKMSISSEKLRSSLKDGIEEDSTNSFNRHVKIGNALSEHKIIGFSDEQKKQSFVGGYELIPDINKYRSDLDNEKGDVPSSLKQYICKTSSNDDLLYVQPDGSIDVTNIISPLKEKNVALEFIVQNYKKCSFEDSWLGKNKLLIIDWSKTPVRLFGGAFPKKTTDLCGFF